MKWQEIKVETTNTDVEAVANVFHELGAGGVSIEDPLTIQQYAKEDKWDAYEFPPEVLESKVVVVKAYFPMDRDLPQRLDDLKNAVEDLKLHLPDITFHVLYSEVQEEDWANSWKAYYKPEKVGERIVIKPQWEDYKPSLDDLVITLDPGMAFGTGNHPTTAMCIRAMEKILQPGDFVYDVGTGSGVLAITAALLGAGEVLAVDLDSVAVRVAGENVEMNALTDKVKVIHGNLLDSTEAQADLIVANIIAKIIVILAPDVVTKLKPGGYFIASGIIQEKAPEVITAMEKSGLRIVDRLQEGVWEAIIATKRGC